MLIPVTPSIIETEETYNPEALLIVMPVWHEAMLPSVINVSTGA